MANNMAVSGADIEGIKNCIYVVRGHRIMLDSDLPICMRLMWLN